MTQCSDACEASTLPLNHCALELNVRFCYKISFFVNILKISKFWLHLKTKTGILEFSIPS